MLTKLNNPDFEVKYKLRIKIPHIMKSRPHEFSRRA